MSLTFLSVSLLQQRRKCQLDIKLLQLQSSGSLDLYTHFKPEMTGSVQRYADRTEERGQCVWDAMSSFTKRKKNPSQNHCPCLFNNEILCFFMQCIQDSKFHPRDTHSLWCLPGPGRTADPWDEPPPPSAHAPVGCWGPRWSQRCSGSVWHDQRTWSKRGDRERTQGHCSLDLRNFQCFETPSCTNGL